MKMKKIALFNNKGGVGKTTLTVNIAEALYEAGKTVLLVDADPQCNLTSFYMAESVLEKLLEGSDDDGGGGTLWSAIKPVVDGRGDIAEIKAFQIPETTIFYLVGDVLLADYEEVLPEAWTDSFARRTRGYDVTTALSRVVDKVAGKINADIVFYDVGPNVGALNRAILLDCDYFITPVAADLFSLRALSTVGRAISKWVRDWETVRSLASDVERPRLLRGRPAYLGYITSAFKVNTGRNAANPHAEWESKIAPRVRDKVVKVLNSVGSELVQSGGVNKIGGVKHFHSLAPEAQKRGVGIGALRGMVNAGHYPQVDEARTSFDALAKEIGRRVNL